MLEARGVRPRRKLRMALSSKAFLKADGVGAGARIASGDRAANAWMAAFKGDIRDAEADHAAFFRTEEAIFPECRDTIDLERGAEPTANFVERNFGEPGGNGFEGCRGNDGWAPGDEVIRGAGWIVADHDRMTKIIREPGCGGFGVGWEAESGCGKVANIGRGRERDAGEVGRVDGADFVQSGGARGGGKTAVERIESPGAIELESTGGADGGGGYFDGIKGLDRVDLDAS